MIKTVIIGYGKIAKKHRQVLEELGFEIIATCNRSVKSNQSSLDDGIPLVYTDFHKMINELKPQAIVISVSSEHIYNVATEIIPYSIPLLIEKPTGNSIIEHNNLIQLSNKYKTDIMVGVNRRFYSLFQKIFKIIGGKEKITNVLIEWSEDPKKLQTRGYSNEKISNIIFANSIHGIDMLCWLVGGIKNPLIHTKNLGSFRLHMNVSGISNEGIIYNFNSCWDSPVPWRIVIYSEDRRFVLAPLETLEYIDNKWKKINLKPENYDIDFKPGFYNQGIAFKELIKSGSNKKASLESITNSMELCQLLYDQLNILNE